MPQGGGPPSTDPTADIESAPSHVDLAPALLVHGHRGSPIFPGYPAETMFTYIPVIGLLITDLTANIDEAP